MYMRQLEKDGRDKKDNLWRYPNSVAVRRAAALAGKPLVGFEKYLVDFLRVRLYFLVVY